MQSTAAAGLHHDILPALVLKLGARVASRSFDLMTDGSACSMSPQHSVQQSHTTSHALHFGVIVKQHIAGKLPGQSGVTVQANVGNYETSARFYIRALSMNPKAASTWGYLRTSLACSGRMDLMELVHESNLDALQKELPL